MTLSQRQLQSAFEDGLATWPGVSLSFDTFAACVGKLGVTEDDLAARGPDLLLVIACGAGDAAAIRQFDAAFLSGVDGRVARFEFSADKLDELRQRLRTKLLVGTSAGIRNYRGRAPLGAWLHVTAIRLAIDIAGTPAADPGIDLLDLASPDQTPEVEATRNLYKEQFKTALEESFRALAPREKTILRLHIVDGLNIDGIGAIYGVHRATAARWLVTIRARILAWLKTEFAVRWNASSSELRSLAWLLRDHIQITAKRVLGSEP